MPLGKWAPTCCDAKPAAAFGLISQKFPPSSLPTSTWPAYGASSPPGRRTRPSCSCRGRRGPAAGTPGLRVSGAGGIATIGLSPLPEAARHDLHVALAVDREHAAGRRSPGRSRAGAGRRRGRSARARSRSRRRRRGPGRSRCAGRGRPCARRRPRRRSSPSRRSRRGARSRTARSSRTRARRRRNRPGSCAICDDRGAVAGDAEDAVVREVAVDPVRPVADHRHDAAHLLAAEAVRKVANVRTFRPSRPPTRSAAGSRPGRGTRCPSTPPGRAEGRSARRR